MTVNDLWDIILQPLLPTAIRLFAQCLVDIPRHGNWSERDGFGGARAGVDCTCAASVPSLGVRRRARTSATR
jgi:hypothetical protein